MTRPRRTYFDGYQLRDAETKLSVRHEPTRFVSIDDIEARLRAGSPNTPGRHIRIEPEPSWREVIYALAGAFAAGVVVWWIV